MRANRSGPATPQDRYLIVSGDDFGLSSQVNKGVLQAHKNGILTNTSLMVTGGAWREAVEIAKSLPTLAIGLHLTLVQGRAALSPSQIPKITDGQGNFSNNALYSGLRYYFSGRVLSQIRSECRAQIERFLCTGLRLSHVDGHLNIHMHPSIMDILLSLKDEYRIPALRLTKENVFSRHALAGGFAWRKTWQAFIFANLARAAEKKLRQHGFGFPDNLFGLHQSGAVDETYLLRLLPTLKAGVSEIYCHPSLLPSPVGARWTPKYRRDLELQALTSQKVRDVVSQEGIQLVSYAMLRSP